MMLPARVPELSALDLFACVAQVGSLSAASRQHGLSQQAVSSRMRAMERELGVGIFERSPSGVTLTPAGRAVLEWANAVLDAARHFGESTASLRGEHRAALTIASSMTIAEYLVPRWLVALRVRLPDLDVRVIPTNSADVINRVRDHSVDLGFVERPGAPADLAHRAIGSDELLIVVRPEHPWATRDFVSIEEVRAQRFIHREPGSGTREAFDVIFGESAPPLLELNSVTAIKAAVASANAPAALSSLSVTTEIADRRLVQVHVAGVSMPRALCAVWRREQPLRGALRDVVDAAIELSA